MTWQNPDLAPEASGVSLGPFLLASSLFGAPWSAMSAVVGSTLASLPEAAASCNFGWGWVGAEKNKGWLGWEIGCLEDLVLLAFFPNNK